MTSPATTVVASLAFLLWPVAAEAGDSFEALRQQFEQRNVQVVQGHPRCAERNLFGLYVRGNQKVVVCPRGNQSNTLLHEGWHLVQTRCLKGNVYHGEEWLSQELSWRDRRDLDALYKTKQWQREAEARYMANQPSDRYFATFDALCVKDRPAAGGMTMALPYRVLSIGDGDTITVGHAQQQNLRVRLACIDAPEMAQRPAGPAARAALQQLLAIGTPVALAIQTTDRYGRSVAEVFRAGDPTPINKSLVQGGYAFVYGRYLQHCDREGYTAAESSAALARRGIWGPLGQGLVKPWDYRAGSRQGS